MPISAKQFQLWSSWVALIVLCATYCAATNQEHVNESVVGNTHVFRHEPWSLASMLLIGLVSARVAWLLRGSPPGMVSAIKMHLAFIGMLVGIVGVFFAFSVAEVNPKGFEVRKGFFGLGDCQAEFADIERIRLTWERHNSGRSGMVSNYFLLCEKKDGTNTKLLVSSDRIMRAVAAHILERVAEHGIPVSKPHGADISMWYVVK